MKRRDILSMFATAGAAMSLGSLGEPLFARSRSGSLDFTLNATPAHELDLNGSWMIAEDPENMGKRSEWFRNGPVGKAVKAHVPDPLELTFPGYNGVVWYWRSFTDDELKKYDDVRLHFQGADYYAEAWINGHYVGGNESALLPFAFNIKPALVAGENRVVVRVVDACYARIIDGLQLGHVPGGRQYDFAWEPGFRHYDYGGLLLPVSVQAFRRPWISDGFIRPDLRHERIEIDLRVIGHSHSGWRVSVRPAFPHIGPPILQKTLRLEFSADGCATLPLKVANPHLWKIWRPFLYEVELTPQSGGTTWRDRFGMREISLATGRIAINGEEIFQRSFLYNQLWPVTLGVPYKDFARRDIELTREANANMLRCFSKTPLPATVTAADEAGILLQPESLASWYLQNGPAEDERLRNITERAVVLYRNHPNILWWNVLNENAPKFDPKRTYPSNEFTLGPFTLATVLPEVHKLDPTRPVIANDPIWHNVPNVWEPGHSMPSLPLVQDHYYQFTNLENNPKSWTTIREREWGSREPVDNARFLAVTEWGLNSAPQWASMLNCYKTAGIRSDAEDYALYKKLYDINRKWYEDSGVKERGFPTPESIEKASHEAVASRYREQMALYLGNTYSVGHGLTSLEDESYELSGVVDIWRNQKPLVFQTIKDLNRPLQVNLWLRPSCLYAGEPITFDVTLLNEGSRLTAGKYPLTIDLLNQANHSVKHKEHTHEVGHDLIEILAVDSLDTHVAAGKYRLRVRLGTNNPELVAERPVVIFARKHNTLTTARRVWIWEDGDVLGKWFAARSITAKPGKAGMVEAGDTLFIGTISPARLPEIHDAVKLGARAVILEPERALAATKPPTGDTTNFAGGLWPLSEGWKPELRQIGWWGSPGAWGYGRTALALQHPFLRDLPQAVALEAQPEYQRLAPRFTWTMQGRPQTLNIRHAVMESNVEVDEPHTSDLFSLPCGRGTLVLTSLRVVSGLGIDPASDKVLENIASELLSSATLMSERPARNASDK